MAHSKEAIVYMILLAFQFGLQPSLTRRFTPPTVCRSTVVLCQELLKFALAFFMLTFSGKRIVAFHGKVFILLFCLQNVTISIPITDTITILTTFLSSPLSSFHSIHKHRLVNHNLDQCCWNSCCLICHSKSCRLDGISTPGRTYL